MRFMGFVQPCAVDKQTILANDMIIVGWVPGPAIDPQGIDKRVYCSEIPKCAKGSST